jgi:hypothetical protein
VQSPGREHWWEQIGPAVRKRIADKVGPAIDWWAYNDPVLTDRPYAVVFGAGGLAVTKPTVSDAGEPAQLLNVRRFVPGSVRHAVVTQLPAPQPPAATTVDPQAAGGGASTVANALAEDVRGFLGNLPVDAQGRLQGPFVTGDRVDEADYFYTTVGNRLHVWCYLAGRRSVTFLSGQREPVESAPHAASWRLICRMAEVAPK